MTPFIFNKIQEQYKHSEKIVFDKVSIQTAVTKKTKGPGHNVTEEHCTCMYFSAMRIPCRHIFKFLLTNKSDLYKPELCDRRWTKAYYYTSHPAINGTQYKAPQQPTHIAKVRVPEEIEKFKRFASMTKDINNFGSNMSNSQFQYFYDKVRNIRSEMRSIPIADSPNDAHQSSNHIMSQTDSDLQNEATLSSTQLIRALTPDGRSNTDQISDSFMSQPIPDRQNEAIQSANQIMSAPIFHHENCVEQTLNPVMYPQCADDVTKSTIESEPVQNEDNPSPSTSNFQRIIMPAKMHSVGRPKGSGRTVIGLKRKNTIKPSTLPADNPIPQKRIKFNEKSFSEQGFIVTNWLTNWPIERIKRSKKIMNGDIIQDAIIFNRLRSEHLNINCIKKYFHRQTFKYIEDEIERLRGKPHVCTKCKKNLTGFQIMCHGCLDWYHGKCIALTATEAKSITYFCPDC